MTDTLPTCYDTALSLSQHARTRTAQRGVTEAAIALLFRFGDVEIPTSFGRRSLRLSSRRAQELAAEELPIAVIDKARRMELILGDGDRVVTVIRCDPAAARRRRAGGRCRSARV
ncbi:hypothetical protein Y590_18388 [Methylobacterium sp. AMS5]|nr:hypothetical protein Y590_18388 [Methylobacterium sp. AMS5]